MRKFTPESTRTHLSTVLLVITLVVSLLSGPVLAHGEASISVSPTAVAPGGTVTLTGEELEAGENFTITLSGIAFERALGTVAVEEEGFEQSFEIPDDAPPGTYRVRATSEEGEVLTTELTIQGGAEPGERTPSDELMDLDRSRSPTELAVIGGLLIASLIAGVVLIRQE
jgi:hypothetical protein